METKEFMVHRPRVGTPIWFIEYDETSHMGYSIPVALRRGTVYKVEKGKDGTVQYRIGADGKANQGMMYLNPSGIPLCIQDKWINRKKAKKGFEATMNKFHGGLLEFLHRAEMEAENNIDSGNVVEIERLLRIITEIKEIFSR